MSQNSAVSDRICEAIKAQRLLKVRYLDGQVRVLEPHLLGEYTDGRTFLFAWLVRCEGDATKAPGWRNYSLSEIQALEVLDDTFDHARPDYNPAGDKRIGRIHCSVTTLRLVREDDDQSSR